MLYEKGAPVSCVNEIATRELPGFERRKMIIEIFTGTYWLPAYGTLLGMTKP